MGPNTKLPPLRALFKETIQQENEIGRVAAFFDHWRISPCYRVGCLGKLPRPSVAGLSQQKIKRVRVSHEISPGQTTGLKVPSVGPFESCID
jgi:hypothetical protein